MPCNQGWSWFFNFFSDNDQLQCCSGFLLWSCQAVNYILNLCDMRPCVVLNDYSEYADDGDLVVPFVNTDTIQ